MDSGPFLQRGCQFNIWKNRHSDKFWLKFACIHVSVSPIISILLLLGVAQEGIVIKSKIAGLVKSKITLILWIGSLLLIPAGRQRRKKRENLTQNSKKL